MFSKSNNLLALLRLRDILASAIKLSVKCPNTIHASGFIVPLIMAIMVPKMISNLSQLSANLNYAHTKEETNTVLCILCVVSAAKVCSVRQCYISIKMVLVSYDFSMLNWKAKNNLFIYLIKLNIPIIWGTFFSWNFGFSVLEW